MIKVVRVFNTLDRQLGPRFAVRPPSFMRDAVFVGHAAGLDGFRKDIYVHGWTGTGMAFSGGGPDGWCGVYAANMSNWLSDSGQPELAEVTASLTLRDEPRTELCRVLIPRVKVHPGRGAGAIERSFRLSNFGWYYHGPLDVRFVVVDP